MTVLRRRSGEPQQPSESTHGMNAVTPALATFPAGGPFRGDLRNRVIDAVETSDLFLLSY